MNRDITLSLNLLFYGTITSLYVFFRIDALREIHESKNKVDDSRTIVTCLLSPNYLYILYIFLNPRIHLLLR